MRIIVRQTVETLETWFLAIQTATWMTTSNHPLTDTTSTIGTCCPVTHVVTKCRVMLKVLRKKGEIDFLDTMTNLQYKREEMKCAHANNIAMCQYDMDERSAIATVTAIKLNKHNRNRERRNIKRHERAENRVKTASFSE